MAPKDNNRHRPRPPRSLPKRRLLNFREQKFIVEFTDPHGPGFLNATVAAELAPYRGRSGSNQLAVQGHRVLRKPAVLEEIMARLHKAGATPEACGRSLARALDASEICEVRNAKGEFELRKVPLYEVQSEALKNYSRFLELYARYGQNFPARPGRASAHGVREQETCPHHEKSHEGLTSRSDNRFSELASQERMLLREAITAAAAWVEIEKRTRAAKAKGPESPPADRSPDAEGDGESSKNGGDS